MSYTQRITQKNRGGANETPLVPPSTGELPPPSDIPIETPVPQIGEPIETPVPQIGEPVETPMPEPLDGQIGESVETEPIYGQIGEPMPEGIQGEFTPQEPMPDVISPESSTLETDAEIAAAGVATGAAVGAAVATSNGSTGEESAEIKDFREKMSDPANSVDFFYLNKNISTEPNKSKAYVREGIFHFTDSMGINAIRDTITAIGNFFGAKGIENAVYDRLRNIALTKVGILLGENRRCYNTRVEFEREADTIFVHIYGTLYSKK
jgi:hypothetical protein